MLERQHMTRTTQLLLITAVFILGGLASWYFFAPKNKPVEESTVLLEKIKTVCKLVTVEGQFSEIYNYSEYSGYFTFFWDKKVLVRVRATVSAGYDLEKVKFEADPVLKIIKISNLPEPQILAIDHTIDYYDISEGIFSGFTPEDYNRINQRAKDLIRDQASRSQLLPSAKTQANQVFDIIKMMAESAGYTLQIEGGLKG